MSKYNKNGFTLVEMILVTAIIGILAGITLNVINIRRVQERARDSRRVADLKRIQTALELYFSDNRSYPSSSNVWMFVQSIHLGAMGDVVGLDQTLMNGYMAEVPRDPRHEEEMPTGVTCTGINYYAYRYISDGDVSVGAGSYVLAVTMETTDKAAESLCSEIPNCTDTDSDIECGTNISSDYCYCVQNPL